MNSSSRIGPSSRNPGRLRSASSLVSFCLLAFLMLVITGRLSAQDVVYAEDFQSGEVPDGWTIGGSGDRRVRVVSLPGFGEGNYKMVLDDSVDDNVGTQVAVEHSFKVNGYSVLSFSLTALSLNDDPQSQYIGNDGVLVSVNGKIVWSATNIVSKVETPGEPITLSGEIYLQYMYDFTPDKEYDVTITLLQFDNQPAPDDGWAYDDILVTGEPYRGATLSFPEKVSEDAGGVSVEVALTPIPTEDTPVVFSSWGQPDRNFTFPANQASSTFVYPVEDDDLLNGYRSIGGDVVVTGYGTYGWSVEIVDDEVATLTLTAPTTLTEGDWNGSNAQLTISPAPADSIYVQVVSDPEGYISDSVWISAGATSASFAMRAGDNYFDDPDIDVTVRAVFGSATSASLPVRILDNDVFSPQWASATFQYMENASPGQALQLNLGAARREAFDVTFSGTPGGVVGLPEKITVEPGQSYLAVPITMTDDSEPQGTRSVNVKATVSGFESTVTVVSVGDDDPSSFRVEYGPYLISGGQGILKVTALDRDGNKIAAYSGSLKLYRVDADGNRTELAQSPVALTDGSYSGNLKVSDVLAGHWVAVESAAGVGGQTAAPMKVIAKFAFGAKDFVYDPISDRLYATTGSDGLAGHLNSVTEIDPYTSTLGRKALVGSGINRIVVTDDGSYLYISQDGSNGVKRIPVADLAASESIPFTDSGWSESSFNAADLLTLPGHPKDFVAVQQDVRTTYSIVRYYKDGVALENGSGSGYTLAAGERPDTFYAFDSTNTGFAFNLFKINETGFVSEGSRSELFTHWDTKIKSWKNWVISNHGGIVDGETQSLVGRFSLPSEWTESYDYYDNPLVHEIDLERSRVYFARGNNIAVYDWITRRLIFSAKLEGLVGKILELERYGDVGLAIRTGNSEMLFIDDPILVPRGDPRDLAVSLSTSTGSPRVNESFAYKVDVSNLSELDAEEVTVALDINASHQILTVESDASSDWSSSVVYGESVTITVPVLSAGDEMQFSINVTPVRVAPLTASVGVTSPALDPDSGNNADSSLLYPEYELAQNDWVRVEIPAKLVEWLPNRGVLLLATDNTAEEGLKQSIVAIDPETGRIVDVVSIGENISCMDASKDETRLYVGLSSQSLLMRVDLTNWTAESIFLSKGQQYYDSFTATDVIALEGMGDAAAVGSYNSGVHIVKDGVVLAGDTGYYTGSVIEPSSSPDTIYAFDGSTTGAAFSKMKITETGASIVSSKSGFFSSFSDRMKSDGDIVVTGGGNYVRGDLMSVEGTFDVAWMREGYWYDTRFDVVPEVNRQRVYFNGANSISSYDTTSFLKVRTIEIPTGSAHPQGLYRWGSDGFAVPLDDGAILIGRSNLVPQSIPYGIDASVDEVVDGVVNVESGTLTLHGHAYAAQGITSVTVNGKSVSTEDGYANWTYQFESVPNGRTAVEVIVTDANSPANFKLLTFDVVYYTSNDLDQDGMDDDWEASVMDSDDVASFMPDGDRDNDGNTNREEFVFGSDANVSDTPYTISMVRDPATGEEWVYLKAKRRLDPHYHFKLYYSVDGSNWARLRPEFSLFTPIDGTEEDYEIILYKIKMDDADWFGAGALFRLKL